MINDRMHMLAGTVAAEDADSAWKVYTPLWVAIIKGTDLPAKTEAPAKEQLEQWSPPLYDTLLSATLDALRNLDLEYHHASEGMPAPSSNDTAMAPEVPPAIYLCSACYLQHIFSETAVNA